MPCLRGSLGPGNALRIIHRRSGNTWLTDKLCCVFSRIGLDIYVFGLQGKFLFMWTALSYQSRIQTPPLPPEDGSPVSLQLFLRCHIRQTCVCARPAGSPSGRAVPGTVLLDLSPGHCVTQTRFSWVGTQLTCGWPSMSGLCFQHHLNRLDFFFPLALSKCLISGLLMQLKIALGCELFDCTHRHMEIKRKRLMQPKACSPGSWTVSVRCFPCLIPNFG